LGTGARTRNNEFHEEQAEAAGSAPPNALPPLLSVRAPCEDQSMKITLGTKWFPGVFVDMNVVRTRPRSCGKMVVKSNPTSEFTFELSTARH